MAFTPVVSDSVSRAGGVKVATWSALTNGAAGDPVSWPEFSGKTFQVTGTFGAGGSVVIEGSNDVNAPTNWSPISNWQGTNIAFSSAGMQTTRDMPLWVRPRVAAGDGTTSVAVALAAHRQDGSTVG